MSGRGGFAGEQLDVRNDVVHRVGPLWVREFRVQVCYNVPNHTGFDFDRGIGLHLYY